MVFFLIQPSQPLEREYLRFGSICLNVKIGDRVLNVAFGNADVRRHFDCNPYFYILLYSPLFSKDT